MVQHLVARRLGSPSSVQFMRDRHGLAFECTVFRQTAFEWTCVARFFLAASPQSLPAVKLSAAERRFLWEVVIEKPYADQSVALSLYIPLWSYKSERNSFTEDRPPTGFLGEPPYERP